MRDIVNHSYKNTKNGLIFLHRLQKCVGGGGWVVYFIYSFFIQSVADYLDYLSYGTLSNIFF